MRAGRIDEAIGRLNEGTAAAKEANFAGYPTGGVAEVPGTPYRSQRGSGDTMPITVLAYWLGHGLAGYMVEL